MNLTFFCTTLKKGSEYRSWRFEHKKILWISTLFCLGGTYLVYVGPIGQLVIIPFGNVRNVLCKKKRSTLYFTTHKRNPGPSGLGSRGPGPCQKRQKSRKSCYSTRWVCGVEGMVTNLSEEHHPETNTKRSQIVFIITCTRLSSLETSQDTSAWGFCAVDGMLPRRGVAGSLEQGV